jgi:ectoine hydroxylase-related dioxygenase (phytanoyl-CoA dioxygenase family)
VNLTDGKTNELPRVSFLQNLLELGFVVLPAAVSSIRLAEIGLAYDRLVRPSSSPGFKAGTTTDRQFFVESRIEFEDVYTYPPLVTACTRLIGASFGLSSLLGRTLRAGTPAQDLHADLPRDSADAPMVGFILMLDAFTVLNGATRFVPRSQTFPDVPSDRLKIPSAWFNGEVLACGDAGSMIIFNAAIWHGHTANTSSAARRSIQGYFVGCGKRDEVPLAS